MPGVHLLPGAPPGVHVSPDSKLSPDKLGKVPCKLTSGGWVGFADWTAHETTLENVKRWHGWKANVLYQTKVAHAIDIDVDDEAVAASLEETFKRVFGAAPVRYRDGSSRRLMLTAIADGETPLRKRRIKFKIGDTEHAVELLGVGQQCVVEGAHPKGGVYQWRDGHPAALGLARLPAMTKAKADEFFAEVGDYLDLMGYAVIAQSQADNKAGTRQALDNPALHAPSPELVLAAMEKWHPDDMGHDEYVQALAAIKGALGSRADEFKDEVLAWSPGVRSTEDNQFEIRWNSIRDSSLGWSWLSAQARKYGFSDDAQLAFDDELPKEWTGQTASTPKAEQPRKTFKYILLSETATLPEPNDFVEDVLCEGQLSVIFGDANVGKTFFAFDLAMRVARSEPWSRKQTDCGLVVFIAGEGAGGVRRRIAAYLKHHGIEDPSGIPFALIPEMVNFRDPNAIETFITTLQEISANFGAPVRWVIVDTLSRALAGGNENAPDDMGALVRGADRVRVVTGAHLSFIHHTGKDETKGARGHSLLRAAVDTEIEIKRIGGARGAIAVTVTKQRDLDIGPPLAFQLATVELGTNRRGKPVTSCIVEEATIKPVLTEAEQEASGILETMLFDAQLPHVGLSAWREAVMSRPGLLTGQTGDSKKKQWQRLRDALKKKGVIVTSGNDVWLKHG